MQQRRHAVVIRRLLNETSLPVQHNNMLDRVVICKELPHSSVVCTLELLSRNVLSLSLQESYLPNVVIDGRTDING